MAVRDFSTRPLTWAAGAWLRFLWWRDHTNFEVSGMCVTAKMAGGGIRVQEFHPLKQTGNSGRTLFDDDALLDYMMAQSARSLGPEQCMRVWAHTHPSGMKPEPSGTDWETYAKLFHDTPWGMMFILAQDGTANAYTSYRPANGPNVCTPVSFRPHEDIDWSAPYTVDLTGEAALFDQLFSELKWSGVPGSDTGIQLADEDEIDPSTKPSLPGRFSLWGNYAVYDAYLECLYDSTDNLLYVVLESGGVRQFSTKDIRERYEKFGKSFSETRDMLRNVWKSMKRQQRPLRRGHKTR